MSNRIQVDKFLIRVIYPLLEKLGEGHSGISQSALTSLQKIAVLHGKSGLSELLAANVDYIVDAISYRMKYPHKLYYHQSHPSPDIIDLVFFPLLFLFDQANILESVPQHAQSIPRSCETHRCGLLTSFG